VINVPETSDVDHGRWGVPKSLNRKPIAGVSGTTCWYCTICLHLVDIATTNEYLLHCDISAPNEVRPMSHKDFQRELVSQLCAVDGMGVSTKRSADHIPVPIDVVTDVSLKATQV